MTLVALLSGCGAKGERGDAPAAKAQATATRPATTKAAKISDAEAAKLAATGPLYPPPRAVPFLTPEQEIETFKLPPGLRAEVVAAEPMVQHPIAITFDPDGRLWVCEMRGYMADSFGKGEDQPSGRVSILEDTDGDGRMDKSTVFLDGLVMPRAISLVRDGLLVAAPPKLIFARDTNGDGVADDTKTIVANDYGDGQNPEHQANGLLHGLDNWLYNANFAKRYRNDSGRWLVDYVRDCGQWGISQDDVGRLFFNSNSDYLRGNYIHPTYATRNPNYAIAGVNVRLDANQECWPAHPTAVNRGYRDGFLRDGRLREFTGACAPLIYRGDLLPAEYYGNAFVAEVSANLIRRAVLSEDDAVITGRNAYDRDEFLTSTYERFRPVDLKNGPDGALYVVDMHHGMIQHKIYLTDYARAQYLARKLDQHLLTGRIFRIVPASIANESPAALPRVLPMSKMLSPALVECLSHPNAWHRETAQRLLVERNSSAATAPLKKLARGGENPLGRIHALWTLDGMHRLDVATIRAALSDADPRVRAQAIRLTEPILGTRQRDELLSDVLNLETDKQPNVRLQFTLTISAVGIPQTDEAIARVLRDDSHNLYVRDAAISGLRARELAFIERLIADPQWATPSSGRAKLFETLAKCVVTEGSAKNVARLLEITADASQPDWRRDALFAGANASAKSKFARKPLMLSTAPAMLLSLAEERDDAATLLQHLAWPGKPGYVPPPAPKPLTASQQTQFELGQQVFARTCVQCHKSDGLGQEGLAPPLVNSDWVLGSERRLARIVLHGLRGPITVDGKTYNLDMPAWSVLSDDEIAGVLTYIRRAWEHTADPVSPELVTKLRAEHSGRTDTWTERELLRIK